MTGGGGGRDGKGARKRCCLTAAVPSFYHTVPFEDKVTTTGKRLRRRAAPATKGRDRRAAAVTARPVLHRFIGFVSVGVVASSLACMMRRIIVES